MSGKRQHFLPRLLTSGFASRRAGKETYTYVFEPDREPREENIINVAAEGYFYGRDSSVDVALTQLESDSFGSLVSQIRTRDALPADAGARLAEFVASLFVRTRNVREVLRDIGTAVGSALHLQYTSPQQAWRELRRCIDEKPEIVLEPVLQHYGVTRIASVPMYRRLQILNHFRKLLDQEAPRFAAQVAAAVDGLRARLQTKDYVQSLHVNALDHDVMGGARVEQLRSFEWSVVVVGAGTVVLGDVGPIIYQPDGRRYDTLLQMTTSPQLVLLPLSDRHLVIGRNADVPAIDDLEEVNRAAVELSYEFFIGSRNTSREQAYTALIGRRAHAAWRGAAKSVEAELDLSRIEADIREAAQKRRRGRAGGVPAEGGTLVDSADPVGSLRAVVDRVAHGIAAAEPVYFNWHLKGWVKRKMWVENVGCEIVERKSRPVFGNVTFQCRLQQSDAFLTKQEAGAATTATGAVSEPRECRITYAIRNGLWVVERREYRFGPGIVDENDWHPVPVDEPTSWPTVPLLMF